VEGLRNKVTNLIENTKKRLGEHKEEWQKSLNAAKKFLAIDNDIQTKLVDMTTTIAMD
jgi:hypothetical protein